MLQKSWGNDQREQFRLETSEGILISDFEEQIGVQNGKNKHNKIFGQAVLSITRAGLEGERGVRTQQSPGLGTSRLGFSEPATYDPVSISYPHL
jgi:hypothetical protein